MKGSHAFGAATGPVDSGTGHPSARALSWLEVLVLPGRVEVYERSGEGGVPLLEQKLGLWGLKLTRRRVGPCG